MTIEIAPIPVFLSAMLAKTVEIHASKKEMLFRCGLQELRFEPVIHLDARRKVVAIGNPPAQSAAVTRIRIFENDTAEESFALLEATIRLALKKLDGVMLFPPTINISIAPDIRADLRGFASAVFYYAARNAGAGKIKVS